MTRSREIPPTSVKETHCSGEKVYGRAGTAQEKYPSRSAQRVDAKRRVLVSETTTVEKIKELCDQVPVVGFNSGKYNLNLVKPNFAEQLSNKTKKVPVAKKVNKTMFLLTDGFRFLDIINYLGPGTSYEKWVRAYKCTAEKSWFPYEWFDSPEKLDY